MSWNPAVLILSGFRGHRLATIAALFVTLSTSMVSIAQGAEQTKLLTEVHFDMGSASITPGGRMKIEQAIAKIKAQNPREIRVIGFTDSTGDEAINQAISLKRADNVASLLAEKGITAPLVIEGKGEKGAPYNVGDNVSEPLNRCVGIIAVGSEETEPLL